MTRQEYAEINKKLSDKEKEVLTLKIVSNAMEKIVALGIKQFVMFNRGKLQVKDVQVLRDIVRSELSLVEKKISCSGDAWDLNVPSSTWEVFSILETAIVERDDVKTLIPIRDENVKTFQDVLDELEIGRYSMTGGDSRTICRSHHCEVIAYALSTVMKYGVGIVKTARSYQPFEVLRAGYGFQVRILTGEEALRKIEQLKNNPITDGMNKKEFETYKDRIVVEAL